MTPGAVRLTLDDDPGEAPPVGNAWRNPGADASVPVTVIDTAVVPAGRFGNAVAGIVTVAPGPGLAPA